MRWFGYTAMFWVAISQISSPCIALGGEPEFSGVFRCDETRDTLCLTGEFPAGQKIFLLSAASGICEAETRGTVEYIRVMDVANVTSINAAKCRTKEDYFLAYKGKAIKDYNMYGLHYVEDNATIDAINKTIRSKGLFDKANEFFEGRLSPKPILLRPIPNNDGVLIVQYPDTLAAEKYGPLFALVNGNVREITTEASVRHLFKLNGHYYLSYYYNCWQGCGNNGNVLMEIKENGINTILDDAFFAH